MIALGIETSTAVCAVGLVVEGKKEIERSVVESHIHSEKLLTLVQEVAAEGGVALSELDCVAVSIGPGSFTGLRIGLSTAKGLCYALGKPLVAVPTFDAIVKHAFDSYAQISKVTVLLDAKKSEYYTGRFERVGKKIKSISDIEVVASGASSYLRSENQTLILTDCGDEVMKSIGAPHFVKDVHEHCHASVVATLGIQKARAREIADLASLEPMYLKDFVVHAPVAQ